MALQKQAIPINFAQGLDLKTDPFQVQPGKFLGLQNSIFTKGGLLQKRNGFAQLPNLPGSTSTTLTTFGGNLVSISDTFEVLSADTSQWLDKGSIQPLELSVVPLVRTSASQVTNDVAIAPNGLACAAYTDSAGASFYQIVDPKTDQIIVAAQNAPLPAGCQDPRVFSLGQYFIITFSVLVTGTPHLRYLPIPVGNPGNPGTINDLSTQLRAVGAGYDAIVGNNNLYIAYDASDVGNAVRVTYMNSFLQQANTVVYPTYRADLMSVSVDVSTSTPNVYVSFWRSSSQNAYTLVVDFLLNPVLAPTQILTSVPMNEITSSANNSRALIFYQTTNTYGYSATRTDYTSKVSITQSGNVGSPSVILRSVGLASKAFFLGPKQTTYVMTVYAGAFQPTYFLIDEDGNAIAKLAYENAGGYYPTQVLPGANITGQVVQIGYLYKDLLESVNKTQNAVSVANIYSQTGINLATFNIDNTKVSTAEIASDLHISGGFLWIHAGITPVEHGFHLWPEDMAVTTSGSGGLLTAQQYQYQITYEWTDAQGNIFLSAPSVPISITTTGATSSNTLNIPTLRITYKTSPVPVRIVIYRWSVAQQTFYKITSIQTPLLNNTSVDSVTYVDTQADSAILGNQILYTTGGVVENIAAPASNNLSLFKSRLFLVDAEDQNLLWYSKQVIQNTPVEMSDLFTIYIPPTLSAQGNTGPITAISALDDKLVVFKKNAIYYITGNGPDNTGANNDFSEPTFITSTVGCINQKSIVFMPNGLMFQSDKGIWLLGRDLNTSYIGAPVEDFNSAAVVSAINVPGTNQVRFTLDSGVTLMYDYYFGQWGTFTNIPAVSSTLYQDLHTFVNKSGLVYQESPGIYLDGSNPVLMSFTTSWFNFAGVQGYERFYEMQLLGVYKSPFKLSVGIGYDYNSSPEQDVIVTNDNYSPAWGGDPLWGSDGPWGGPGNIFEARVFPTRQKVSSFQIIVNELYDSSHGLQPGAAPGAGLTLSGLNLVVGMKKGYRTNTASRSFG